MRNILLLLSFKLRWNKTYSEEVLSLYILLQVANFKLILVKATKIIILIEKFMNICQILWRKLWFYEEQHNFMKFYVFYESRSPAFVNISLDAQDMLCQSSAAFAKMSAIPIHPLLKIMLRMSTKTVIFTMF